VACCATTASEKLSLLGKPVYPAVTLKKQTRSKEQQAKHEHGTTAV